MEIFLYLYGMGEEREDLTLTEQELSFLIETLTKALESYQKFTSDVHKLFESETPLEEEDFPKELYHSLEVLKIKNKSFYNKIKEESEKSLQKSYSQMRMISDIITKLSVMKIEKS